MHIESLMQGLRCRAFRFIGLVVACAAGCSNPPGQSQESPKWVQGTAAPAQTGGGARVDDLIKMVLDKQPAAALIAKKLGPGANKELIKLTANEDAKVRLIAIYCLQETGGTDAAWAFARLVLDEDPQVRGAALNGLMQHPDPAAGASLLNAYDGSPDPYARQQIMLILGRMGISKDELKKRYANEKDPQAKEGSMVVLAKLGDPEAEQEFIDRLHASQGRERARFLEYCKYINAPWLSKALLPLLDDKSSLIWIGVDGRPELPQYLRACDIAVNIVATVTKHSFSFQIKDGVNYTDAQITEVRDFAKTSR